MASRRTVMANDRRRNSRARKETHKATIQRQQQQAKVFRGLWKAAMAEARSGS